MSLRAGLSALLRKLITATAPDRMKRAWDYSANLTAIKDDLQDFADRACKGNRWIEVTDVGLAFNASYYQGGKPYRDVPIVVASYTITKGILQESLKPEERDRGIISLKSDFHWKVASKLPELAKHHGISLLNMTFGQKMSCDHREPETPLDDETRARLNGLYLKR